jgi:hypothetical protein
VTGYQAPDPLQERRRVRAAGFAHIDRIAVDGGPVIEPKPIRRHFVRNVVGVIGVAICAIGVTVVVWGCVG